MRNFQIRAALVDGAHHRAAGGGDGHAHRADAGAHAQPPMWAARLVVGSWLRRGGNMIK